MTQQLRLTLSLLIFASACGGAHRQPSSAPGPSTRSMGMDDAAAESDGESYADDASIDPRERIARLSDDIGRMRIRQGMSREPNSEDVREAHPAPAPGPESYDGETASVAATSVCEDTCRLKESICRNSASICKLAAELAPDEWAEEKCDSGKVSCSEATTSCDECN